MGSGKTYYGVELCVQAFREGAIVHSNIDFCVDRIFAEGWGDQFVPLGDDPAGWQPLIKAGKEGQENLVVIDEGMLHFDSHDWQATAKKHKTLMEFLIWSRKLGLDVYMIGQAQKGMDVKFTRMSLAVFRCVAVKTMFIIGPWWSSVRGAFLRVQCSPDGQVRGDRKYARFDPFIGGLYKTESMHGRFGDVERVVTRKPKDERSAVKRSWLKFAAFVGMIVGGLWGAQALAMKALLPDRGGKSVVDSPAPPTVATVETPPLPVASATVPTLEKPVARMRVWGVADWGRLTFWESGTGRTICVGGVIDDREIIMVRVRGRIVTVTLDNGDIVKFRPAERADAQPAFNQQINDVSWKKWLSSDFTFPASLQDSLQRSSGKPSGK